jgi:hypothetical protein
MAHLAVAAQHEALDRQRLGAHRTVGVQAGGGDSISAPRPSSPPSLKRDEVLTITTAARNACTKRPATASLRVAMTSGSGRARAGNLKTTPCTKTAVDLS